MALVRTVASVPIGIVAFVAVAGVLACKGDDDSPNAGSSSGAGDDGGTTSSGGGASSSGASSGGSGSASSSSGGAADASCASNAITCNGKRIERCDANGMVVVEKTCIADCVASPSPHCPVLEPKYVGNVCETMPTMALDTAAANALDTSLDANCTLVITQANGPDICVVARSSITIGTGSLVVTGSRALALVAVTGDLTVNGVIDVGATKHVSGPGGGTIVSGAASTSSAGGGGAGFGTAGAAGGDTLAGNGGAGGAAVDPLALGMLVGGARAPKGTGIINAVAGGGGGGALTLIACRATVSIAGIIDARGGGGAAQHDTVAGGSIAQSDCAAGGGSGGYVVIQGLDVRVTGEVYANGGAGGGANTSNDASGQAGEDGTRSATTAAKGGTGSGGGANGGNGAIVGVAPAGGGGTATGVNGGGGGGACGRLQVYTPMSVTPTLTPSGASPAFEPSGNLPTH